MPDVKRAVLRVEDDGSFHFVFQDAVTLLPGQHWDVTLQQRPDLGALRRLRLYHWRQVCKLSDSLCSGRGLEASRQRWREDHAMHMRAVQALNDLFPLGDTAERDDSQMSAGATV